MPALNLLHAFVTPRRRGVSELSERWRVGEEMVLPWQSLPCTDFPLLLFANCGPVSHLAFVNSLRAAFYHDFYQTLSVGLSQAHSS